MISTVSYAQSLEKRALKNIEKQKWDKAASLLRKSKAKDSMNVIADFVWSRFYFAGENPLYDIDLAYSAAQRSLENFRYLTARQRDKISRFPLDSLSVVALREQIDSVAFTIARKQNTEEAYIRFIANHPFSSDRQTAEQLRNAVAFLDAVNRNTFKAFKDFLDKYPNADQRVDAKARYERLLFEEKTRDRRLASFEAFLKEYPETPFRKEIERDIFELFTLSGEVERFLSYVKLYPGSPFQNRATNILFHILYDSEEDPPSGIALTDSLQRVLALNEGYLTPFLKHGKFGFMNNKGFEVIAARFDELPDDYRCGNITDDLLVFPNRIVNRLGVEVFAGPVDDFQDLGVGFITVKSGDCVQLIHKSGRKIDSCVLDAKMIDKRFVAIQSEKGWSIRSLAGRPILSGYWDEIGLYGKVIGLKKEKNIILFNFKQLADQAHEQEFSASHVVNEIKLLSNGMLWVSVDGQEGVYDQNLKEVVTVNDHKIEPYFGGFIIRTPEGFSVSDFSGNQSSFFERVKVKDPMVIVRKDGREYLFNVAERKFRTNGYDSIAFDGTFLKGWMSDSVSIQFEHLARQFPADIKTSFVSGKDSVSYLLIETDGKKVLFNDEGTMLCTLPSNAFETIQHAGRDLFIVSRKDKKGVIDAGGKVVLPIEYDAIGSIANQTISVLKGSRFGLFNITSRKLVKPQYDKNISPYRDNLLIAFKDGRQGFVDWDNKTLGRFDLEEIRYWNDSVALVKRRNTWELLDLGTFNSVIGDIREITPIKENADEKLYIMNQNNLVGVVSSVRGKVIPFSFSDVINVGSKEEPLYFTEKHVSEASVFVVIYYDKNGKMLRREVYEEPDDYERIYCKQN
ncbi:MAG TPA: WG repeat-containing protein [Chryseosolibacter sp.]